MSDTSQLVLGVLLTLAGVGSLIAVLPRKGRTVWFARMPFLASGVPLLMIGTFAIGLILIAAYFTTIDNATLSGLAKHL